MTKWWGVRAIKKPTRCHGDICTVSLYHHLQTFYPSTVSACIGTFRTVLQFSTCPLVAPVECPFPARLFFISKLALRNVFSWLYSFTVIVLSHFLILAPDLLLKIFEILCAWQLSLWAWLQTPAASCICFFLLSCFLVVQHGDSTQTSLS